MEDMQLRIVTANVTAWNSAKAWLTSLPRDQLPQVLLIQEHKLRTDEHQSVFDAFKRQGFRAFISHAERDAAVHVLITDFYAWQFVRASRGGLVCYTPNIHRCTWLLAQAHTFPNHHHATRSPARRQRPPNTATADARSQR